MSQRLPPDVFAKTMSVVHRFIQMHGDPDVKWYWSALVEEAIRAREMEELRTQQAMRKERIS